MSYLGNTPTTQSFIAGTDTFNGTGAQTAFTLTRTVNSVNDVLVVVNNVDQYPPNYSVSGTTLTISPAPSAGTNNVYVRYMSTTLQSNGVSDLSVSTGKIQDNAITTAKIASGAVIPAGLSTGAPVWDTSGNLLVGTPTTLSGNKQITVVGAGTARGALQMGCTTAQTSGVAGSLIAYNGSNAICGIDWQANGANNSGYIGTYTYSAGVVAQGPYLNTGGTNWTAASDERLKNVTGEIENALYKVSQIRAVEFTWKADILNKQNIGFIAQDVQVVLPEVIDTDTNGNLGVRYAEVTSLLLAAIKEQQALITQLQADVAALKGATP